MADDGKIWAALITALIALAGTAFTAYMARRNRIEQDRFKLDTDRTMARLAADLTAERDRRLARDEVEKVTSKFKEPLLHAAYDLQSRIFNIMRRGFLPAYLINGSPREQQYAVENTLFLVAQFLGWTELIRQEIRFVDLASDNETRQLRELQDSMYSEFQTDAYGKGFRLFAGEQRAVGELMIDRSGDAPRCIGFAAFLTSRKAPIDVWLDPLRDDVKQMAVDLQPYSKRLGKIQHALIDLLEFLDPEYVRFPQRSRGKI